MMKSIDPWAAQRAMWRTFGSAIAGNPLVTAGDVVEMHKTFEQQAMMVELINPYLAKIMGEMSAEFYGSAMDRLRDRGIS